MQSSSQRRAKMHKLDPIERLPDGSLFRLTPGQLRSVRGLAKRCCNFLDGECLLLDGALPAVYLPQPALPVVSTRRAAPAAKAGTGHSQSQKTPPLRSLRHGHPRPLRQDKILPRLCQGGSPPAEGEIRPQTAVGRRQFRGEKPLNCKHSRTAKAARQYVFPRSREIEFYLST